MLLGSPAADKGSLLALLLGSAVNQDGRSSSLTAPNGPAQQDVLLTALRAATAAPHHLHSLQARRPCIMQLGFACHYFLQRWYTSGKSNACTLAISGLTNWHGCVADARHRDAAR